MQQNANSQQPTSEQIAAAGREAGEFMGSTLWRVLQSAVRGFQDSRTKALMGLAPTNEGATYAALVGEAKGISRIEPLLEGLIRAGEEAEAEIRKAEEEGSS